MVMAVAMFSFAAFSSCSSNDDPVNESNFLANTYKGTTYGTSQQFQNLPSTSEDVVTISNANEDATVFNIDYSSDFWGSVSFKNVGLYAASTGQFTFNQAEGTFRMPKRMGAQATGDVEYGEYPAKLVTAMVHLLGNKYMFRIQVDLGERAGTYDLIMTNMDNIN